MMVGRNGTTITGDRDAKARLARATDPARWERTIQGFEAGDRASPPAPGGIVFVGSSTFTFWVSLEEDMAPLPVIRRGFGGSTIADVVHFTGRLVIPCKPRAVVLYAGDNDVAIKAEHGLLDAAARACLEDFEAFASVVHAALPATRIFFVSIKPSIARWALWPVMREANDLIRARCARGDRLAYIDIEPAMLGTDGTPRRELFGPDLLHLDEAGYAAWTTIIKPALAAGHEILVKEPPGAWQDEIRCILDPSSSKASVLALVDEALAMDAALLVAETLGTTLQENAAAFTITITERATHHAIDFSPRSGQGHDATFTIGKASRRIDPRSLCIGEVLPDPDE